eukprot:11496666-Heterocapsa_arctica.AAC.1
MNAPECGGSGSPIISEAGRSAPLCVCHAELAQGGRVSPFRSTWLAHPHARSTFKWSFRLRPYRCRTTAE